MSNLYSPTKEDRAAINSGIRKIRLHYLRKDGRLEEVNCPFCIKRVLKFKEGYLTLTGSQHKCKAMRVNED